MDWETRCTSSKIGNLVSSGNESHMIHDYQFNIFNPEVFNLDPKRDWYLSGYWQNLQYFDWNKEEVKKVFDFSLDLDERKKNSWQRCCPATR